jgi:hypothetical protein
LTESIPQLQLNAMKTVLLLAAEIGLVLVILAAILVTWLPSIIQANPTPH